MKFDLVHVRLLAGSFSTASWDKFYKQVYHNLAPGGWIEQVEAEVGMSCDDKTLPPDSPLTSMGDKLEAFGVRTGNTGRTVHLMRGGIEKAGFTNIHEHPFKAPLGAWAKGVLYKEAGAMNLEHYKEGLEGWIMWVFTKYGEPEPWSAEQVQVYVKELKEELDKGYHIYQRGKRIWAQKPYDAPKAKQEPTVDAAS